MMEDYKTVRREAIQALNNSDPRAAFQALRGVLEYPGHKSLQRRWSDAFDVFAKIGATALGEEFAVTVRNVALYPNDVSVLYTLGYELIERSLPAIAATVLARANALAPGEEAILTELVCALEHAGYNSEACRFLREVPELLEKSFLCNYLLAFNALMTGDLREPRLLLPRLQQSHEPDYVYMTGQIAGMLQRADALTGVLPLDSQDLRGWHFVVNGAILLHLSPYGFNEGMNGRYAYIHDSKELIIEGIQRLVTVLDTWKLPISRVFVLPDRNSAILAFAVAQILQCPLEQWSKGSQSPGLIVAYDLAQLESELLLQLAEHRCGQLLWSHANCWTEPPPFSADFQTYLYQTNVSPWSQGMSIYAEPEYSPPTPIVETNIEEFATSIVSSTLAPCDLEDLPALVALAQAAIRVTGEHAAGAFQQTGSRRRQRVDSPVPSSRFV